MRHLITTGSCFFLFNPKLRAVLSLLMVVITSNITKTSRLDQVFKIFAQKQRQKLSKLVLKLTFRLFFDL